MYHLPDGIHGIIFDLDGTLVDSMWVWNAIDIEYLGSFGIPVPEDLQILLGGLSFTETAVYFKEHFGIPDPIEKIEADWNRMAFEKYRDDVRLKEGAGDFLRFLKGNRIPAGIATSNSMELVETLLASLGISDCFGAIVTGHEVSKGKPDPEIYLTCAERLGIVPADILAFEDVVNGILSARRAGMKVCAVYDDHCSRLDDEKRELADYFIYDYLAPSFNASVRSGRQGQAKEEKDSFQ